MCNFKCRIRRVRPPLGGLLHAERLLDERIVRAVKVNRRLLCLGLLARGKIVFFLHAGNAIAQRALCRRGGIPCIGGRIGERIGHRCSRRLRFLFFHIAGVQSPCRENIIFIHLGQRLRRRCCFGLFLRGLRRRVCVDHPFDLFGNRCAFCFRCDSGCCRFPVGLRRFGRGCLAGLCCGRGGLGCGFCRLGSLALLHQITLQLGKQLVHR